jgi:uncharacterized membrane protein YkoI
MRRRNQMTGKVRRTLVVLAAIGAAGLGAAALAGATGGDDDASDQPITGTALERAEAAALEHTDGGTVTETETGDEESRYEVEVTRADGSQVDVQLDGEFTVVGDEADEDGSESEADDD